MKNKTIEKANKLLDKADNIFEQWKIAVKNDEVVKTVELEKQYKSAVRQYDYFMNNNY